MANHGPQGGPYGISPNTDSALPRGAIVNITLDEIITWLLVGALAGSLAGMVVTRRKEGFGGLTNLGIGLVGAILGGALFKLFHIELGLLAAVTITLQDVVSGLVGALLFLAILWWVQRYRAKKKSGG